MYLNNSFKLITSSDKRLVLQCNSFLWIALWLHITFRH